MGTYHKKNRTKEPNRTRLFRRAPHPEHLPEPLSVNVYSSSSFQNSGDDPSIPPATSSSPLQRLSADPASPAPAFLPNNTHVHVPSNLCPCCVSPSSPSKLQQDTPSQTVAVVSLPLHPTGPTGPTGPITSNRDRSQQEASNRTASSSSIPFFSSQKKSVAQTKSSSAPKMDQPHAPVPADAAYDRTGAHMKGVQMFIQRTYELVSSLDTEYCVSWSDDGRSFILSDYDAVQDQLPNFFTSGKISSFIRQLNMYSFRERGEKGHWEYAHPFFLRGRTDLLRFIKRQKKRKPTTTTTTTANPKPSANKSAHSSRAPSPTQSSVSGRGQDALVHELRTDLADCRATLKSFQTVLDQRNAQVAALQNELSLMRTGVKSILTDQKTLLSQFEAVQSAFLAATCHDDDDNGTAAPATTHAAPAVGAKRKRPIEATKPTSSPSLLDLFPQISPRTHNGLVVPMQISKSSRPSSSASGSAKNPKPFPKISTSQVPSSSIFRAPKRTKPLSSSSSSSSSASSISVQIPTRMATTAASSSSSSHHMSAPASLTPTPGESPSFADILALITPTLSQIFEAPPALDLHNL